MELFNILIILCCLSVIAAELSDQLHYFETLHHVDVKSRKKRSASDISGLETKDVHFSALGRTFDLVLTPGSPVIGSDFSARLVHGDGSSSRLHLNLNEFYSGHLAGNENVRVDAHSEAGIWTANIYDVDDIISLEPSYPHLPRSNNHTMIIYRQSDLKWESIYPELANKSNRIKLCGGIHAEDEPDYNPEPEVQQENIQREKHISRQKRATGKANTCHVVAVADHEYFKGPGGGFAHRTANSLIQTMQSVNNIYRSVLWNQDLDLKNLGFQIKELVIHDEKTAAKDYHSNGLHYNMDRSYWKDIDLLRQFGYAKNFDTFCLAHLFTHRRFDGGVLGLAYIASSRRETLGGICSSRRSGGRTLNTGFSSSMNTKGNNLLTQEAVLVTVHGHNWGAEHDADTDECAPSSFDNGKYVMYPYAVSGYEENNKRFSPCSKRYVTNVLTAKSDKCFKEKEAPPDTQQPNVPMCGNGKVETGEECDAGSMGINGMDECCSADCKFIGDATCSSVNYECCQNCQPAPAGTVCRAESFELCKQEAVCSGYSRECPFSKNMDPGTPCIDGGKCLEGQCANFCEYEGFQIGEDLSPCRCDTRETACLRCCRRKNGECKPRGNPPESEVLMDGRPCDFGYCEEGKCIAGRSTIQRLFSFIETLDSNTLVAFMKSNIVGTVIVFSLIIWIPASWVVSCIDKKHERESRKREDAWSTTLANRLENYKVKESDLHRTTGRPLLQGAAGGGGGAGEGNTIHLQDPPPRYTRGGYMAVPGGTGGNGRKMETSM